MSEPDDPAAPVDSVFLRITGVGDDGKDPVVVALIEVDAEGYIPREVGLRGDGTAVYVTRPGEYGRWNDSEFARTPPGTHAFDAQWAGLGTLITREEFEGFYDPADATLPHTMGGTPMWLSNLVSFSVLVVLLLVVLGVVYAVVRLIGG